MRQPLRRYAFYTDCDMTKAYERLTQWFEKNQVSLRIVKHLISDADAAHFKLKVTELLDNVDKADEPVSIFED